MIGSYMAVTHDGKTCGHRHRSVGGAAECGYDGRRQGVDYMTLHRFREDGSVLSRIPHVVDAWAAAMPLLGNLALRRLTEEELAGYAKMACSISDMVTARCQKMTYMHGIIEAMLQEEDEH